MDIFINMLIEYLAEVVAIIVIGALGIFGTWLLNKIKQKKGLENIAIATEQVIRASQNAVLELQQTLVEGWKSAQNGKLTNEQIEELKESVLEIAFAQLAAPTMELLTSAKVDITAMIISAAEGYVLELKKKSN